MNVAEFRRSEAWHLFLLRLRYREGRIVDVAGNEPILLNDERYAWIVYTGNVDVFAVKVVEDKSIGARHPLFRAEEGQGLFGIAQAKSEIELVANGTPGSLLLKVARSSLEEVALEPEFIDAFVVLIDRWITDLSKYIACDLSPRYYTLLEAGQELRLDQGEIARAQKDVQWIEHLEGRSQFVSREEVALNSRFVPISSETWLKAVGPTTIRTTDTRTVFQQNQLWPNLEQFHSFALRCLTLNVRKAEQADAKRLIEKAHADQARVDKALSELASILHAERQKDFTDKLDQDPLLTACQLIGRRLGIPIRNYPAASVNSPPDRLQLIAHESRLRLRQVALRGDWWKTDSGPLLAYLEADKHPVALLPTSPTTYVLHDPVIGTETPVTESLAASLRPLAYTFYRPFPDRPLGIWELLKFGLHNAFTDLRTIVLTSVMVGLLGILPPILLGILFDRIIPSAQRDQVLLVALVLLGSAVAAILFELTRNIAVLRIEGNMEYSIQAAVFDRVLSLPTAFFRDYSAGDLGIRAMGISAIRQILSRQTLSSFVAGITSVFNLLLLFLYDVRLALVAVLLVAIVVSTSVVASIVQLRYERASLSLQGKIAGTVLQFINGIAKFRVAAAERRAFAVWAHQFAEQRKLTYRARTVQNRLITLNSAFPVLASLVIFAMIVISGGTDRLSVGSFLAFNFAFTQFLTAALAMISAFAATLSIIPIYERSKPILQTLPEVDDAKADPGELSGRIEVDSVNFRYASDGPPILSDVSFQILQGQFVALVGPSGSGKSTLLRLLLGFESPESGAIYYDGQELSSLDIRSVRRQIGTVLQTGKLITGDIFTNIAGISSLTIDDAWEAARMAGLEEDIRQMPMGMHTVISEGGGTLSGGQRQRLIIARAIVNRPRILFFDEATSALDNRTQETVGQSLERLQATRVVIAHRLSTIRNADMILVVEKGRIVQRGAYNELMGQRGTFAELAKRQLI